MAAKETDETIWEQCRKRREECRELRESIAARRAEATAAAAPRPVLTLIPGGLTDA